jgi:hypothetical protein
MARALPGRYDRPTELFACSKTGNPANVRHRFCTWRVHGWNRRPEEEPIGGGNLPASLSLYVDKLRHRSHWNSLNRFYHPIQVAQVSGLRATYEIGSDRS